MNRILIPLMLKYDTIIYHAVAWCIIIYICNQELTVTYILTPHQLGWFMHLSFAPLKESLSKMPSNLWLKVPSSALQSLVVDHGIVIAVAWHKTGKHWTSSRAALALKQRPRHPKHRQTPKTPKSCFIRQNPSAPWASPIRRMQPGAQSTLPFFPGAEV